MKNIDNFNSIEDYEDFKQHVNAARILYLREVGKPINITKAVLRYAISKKIPESYFFITTKQSDNFNEKREKWDAEIIETVYNNLLCPECMSKGIEFHFVYEEPPRCPHVNPNRYKSFFDCENEQCFFHFYLLASVETLHNFAEINGWESVFTNKGKAALGFINGQT